MSPDPVRIDSLRLEEARGLAARREWRALAERADALDRERLLEDPELGYHCAHAWIRVGEVARALDLAEELEPRIRAGADRRLTLQAANLLGALLFEAGRTAEAEERFGELLDRSTEWKDDEFAARASNNLGIIANVRGERERALACYQRALAAYQRLGYVRGLAQTHYNLGISYRELGFAAEADSHYEDAIRFAEQSDTQDVIGLAESDRGLLCIQTGDPRKGEAFARRARDRFQRLGDPIRTAETLRVLAAAARAQKRPGDAAALLDDALDLARGHPHLLLLAEVQRDRGLVLGELGDPAGARAALLEAADHFARLGAPADRDATLQLAGSLPA